MPKQPLPKSEKKTSSGKIDTAIIVALIALVGTLGTALFNSPVILEWIKNMPTQAALSSQPMSTSIPANPAPVSLPQALPGINPECLAQNFVDIDPSRQFSLEVGAISQDYQILSQDLARKDFFGPVGIKLTQNGKMIAALSFIFFNDNHLFKITSLVDSNCHPVNDYSNVDQSGDRNAVQDSDTLKINLSQGSYSLRFIYYGPASLRFDFQQLP